MKNLIIGLVFALSGCAVKSGDGATAFHALAPDWFATVECELRPEHTGPHVARIATRFSGVQELVQWETGHPVEVFTVTPRGAWGIGDLR